MITNILCSKIITIPNLQYTLISFDCTIFRNHFSTITCFKTSINELTYLEITGRELDSFHIQIFSRTEKGPSKSVTNDFKYVYFLILLTILRHTTFFFLILRSFDVEVSKQRLHDDNFVI